MKIRLAFIVLIAASLTTIACGPQTQPQPYNDAVYQYAPIELLLAGQYDGELTVGELRKHGTIGIGTFNRLDGELVMLDGKVWQIKSDGKVYPAGDEMRLPFAIAAYETYKLWGSAYALPLGAFENFEGLQAMLDSNTEDYPVIFMARIDGTFRYVKVRSVPAQDKPYKRLADAAKGQTVFEYRNISGTIVAFRFPDSTGTLNVPGWHMHFISADRKVGGHVLDVQADGSIFRLWGSQNLHLQLPLHSSPLTTQPAGTAAHELHMIEK
ncbi:MAG: acetolactate decarboxylase [Planctomycetaceae bacterium]|nr:MAG: acetolactate decarboxylase [Planctomycetaceae bacterium]